MYAQAEMLQKEQQIQVLKSNCKSRPTLMPLLMNGVAHCERSVGKEVSASLAAQSCRLLSRGGFKSGACYQAALRIAEQRTCLSTEIVKLCTSLAGWAHHGVGHERS